MRKKQEPLGHIISGALFDFVGWLTSRKEQICFSSKDNAVPAVDALVQFLVVRGVYKDCEPRIKDWMSRCN